MNLWNNSIKPSLTSYYLLFSFEHGFTTSSLMLPYIFVSLSPLSRLECARINRVTMSTIAGMTRLVLVGIVPLVAGSQAIQQKALRGGGAKLKVGTPYLAAFLDISGLVEFFPPCVPCSLFELYIVLSNLSFSFERQTNLQTMRGFGMRRRCHLHVQ